jgi:hypothetical protein
MNIPEALGVPRVLDGIRVAVAHGISFLCCVLFFLRTVSCVPIVASASGMFQIAMSSLSITTNVVSSNHSLGEVNSMQHLVCQRHGAGL